MSNLLLSLIVGAMIGWVVSMITRKPTSEAIALDIGVGVDGALLATIVLGRNSPTDAFTASYLGAGMFLAVMHWAGRRTVRSPRRRQSQSLVATPKPPRARSKAAKTTPTPKKRKSRPAKRTVTD